MLGMTLQAGVANLRGIAEYFSTYKKFHPPSLRDFGCGFKGIEIAL
jgi:hypothetical protein